MSRAFDVAMPNLDSALPNGIKRSRVETNGGPSFPLLTEHGTERQYGSAAHPFINSMSSAPHAMQSDNAIDTSAVNAVVTTILATNTTANPLSLKRGDLRVFVQSKTGMLSPHYPEATRHWTVQVANSTEDKDEMHIMVLAEPVVIPPQTSVPVAIAAYGPALINLDKEGLESVALYDRAVAGGNPTQHDHTASSLINGAVYACTQRLATGGGGAITQNARVFTMCHSGPMDDSFYVVLHEAAAKPMCGIFGV